MTQIFLQPPSSRRNAKADDLEFLRLVRSRRVGPASFHRLLAEHGSVAAALDALPGIAAAAGVEGYAPCSEAEAEAEIAAGRKAGARLLRCDSREYPGLLRQIPDAPPVLWVRGDPAFLSGKLIAVIGARNASSLGRRMARGLSVGLGEAGHTIVAGLARGVDTAAHLSALPTGTVAVMASGIDVIYPRENTNLAAEIAGKGALITEYPPGMAPAARHFPARNRIISGLSRAVVVVEAAHRSGSLITARNALDQGREVMAVPGHPMDARAGGCNRLICEGAQLVRSAADVIDALDRYPDTFAPSQTDAPEQEPSAPPIARMPACRDRGGPVEVESRILDRLSLSPIEENELIRDLGLPPAAINSTVQLMELQGSVIRLAGGLLAAR